MHCDDFSMYKSGISVPYDISINLIESAKNVIYAKYLEKQQTLWYNKNNKFFHYISVCSIEGEMPCMTIRNLKKPLSLY